LTATALASGNSKPGNCRQVHRFFHETIGYWQPECLINQVVPGPGVPVHATTSGRSRVVGTLAPGLQPFNWQQAGPTSTLRGRSSDVWAYTTASNGRQGYVNELWFSPAPRNVLVHGLKLGNCAPWAELPWHGGEPKTWDCLS
jgi:hypothetical protein